MSIDLLIQTSTPPKAVSKVGVRKNQKINDELQILVHLYTTRRTCDKLGILPDSFILLYILLSMRCSNTDRVVSGLCCHVSCRMSEQPLILCFDRIIDPRAGDAEHRLLAPMTKIQARLYPLALGTSRTKAGMSFQSVSYYFCQ